GPPRAGGGSGTGSRLRADGPLGAGGPFRGGRTARSAGGGAAERGRARPARGVPGLRAPMVGRDHELDLLRSIYGRLASSGRAQLVTIYGDPGIGKSRLTREVLGPRRAGGGPAARPEGRG